MKEALTNLLKVKSIVTILLTLVVCYLAILGKFDLHDIYITIIAFYFGTQFQKAEDKKSEENTEKIVG